MAGADYSGIRDAIAAQIRTQVPGTNVVAERIPMMEQSPKVCVYLQSRTAPENRQALCMGRKTRFLCSYSVWVYAYALRVKDAISACDSLMAQVELALLADETFGRADVLNSWQESGESDFTRKGMGFNVGAELRLIVDVAANVAGFLLLRDGSSRLLQRDNRSRVLLGH